MSIKTIARSAAALTVSVSATTFRDRRIYQQGYLSEGPTGVDEALIEEVASGRPCTFQQDSAPAHTAHVVMSLLQDNLDIVRTPDFWPPNSLDLNPLDCFVWGVVKRASLHKSGLFGGP